MKKIIAGILLIGVFVIAAVTCPKQEDHSKKLAQVDNQSVKNTVKEHVGGGLGGGLAALSSIVTGGIVKGIVNEIIDVDNYVLFSLGKVNLPTETKIVSVGLFNQVITIDSESLSKAIEENAGNAFDLIKSATSD
jgi:hypothetical protein